MWLLNIYSITSRWILLQSKIHKWEHWITKRLNIYQPIFLVIDLLSHCIRYNCSFMMLSLKIYKLHVSLQLPSCDILTVGGSTSRKLQGKHKEEALFFSQQHFPTVAAVGSSLWFPFSTSTNIIETPPGSDRLTPSLEVWAVCCRTTLGQSLLW